MLLLFFKQKIAVPYPTVPPERTPLPLREELEVRVPICVNLYNLRIEKTQLQSV